MAKMYNEACELMIKESLHRAEEKTQTPIKNFQDLYELWLDCCKKTHQNMLQSSDYQKAYGSVMNAMLEFWKSVLPK